MSEFDTQEVTETTITNTLSHYEALEAQAKQINEEMEVAKKAAYTEAIDTIKSLMHKFNIQHISLGKKAHKKDRNPVAPKYQNPNGEGTWTGRGKPCKWYLEAIKAGYAPEDMLISK